ncbi:ACT domain-containing protein ACR11-like [Sesbania bispinosa]|nr:ACT domain-containing protein ACR11-like [Sesbania bispinosa]
MATSASSTLMASSTSRPSPFTAKVSMTLFSTPLASSPSPLVLITVKLPFGNLGCEKSWSQSHSRYGICLRAHYHFRVFKLVVQESSSRLAMGAAFGLVPLKEQVDVDIATHINISDDGPDRSLLYVETADRPGLLVDLVKIITDIDIAVESGEFDTEGLLAKAKFHVNYKGKAITKPLQQVLANSLIFLEASHN